MIFIRDLLRPADDATVEQLVATYAAGANEHQRQLFDQSLRAALDLDEARALAMSVACRRSLSRDERPPLDADGSQVVANDLRFAYGALSVRIVAEIEAPVSSICSSTNNRSASAATSPRSPLATSCFSDTAFAVRESAARGVSPRGRDTPGGSDARCADSREPDSGRYWPTIERGPVAPPRARHREVPAQK